MAENRTQRVFSSRQSRQGPKGRPVLLVLMTSLVLAAIAWFAAEMWGEATEPPISQQTAPPASTSGENGAPAGTPPAGFDDNPPQGSRPATGGTERSPSQ